MSLLHKLFGLHSISVGTWEEFEELDRKNKEEHPIRYKMLNGFLDSTISLSRSIHDIKWGVLHRVHPKHRYHVVDTKLKPGYYDPDRLILNACFSLFVDFYEQTGETISWEATERHAEVKREMDELYYWWTEERGKRAELMPKLPDFPESWGNSPMFNPKYEGTPEMEAWNEACHKLWEADEFYEEEDKHMLKKLMDVREFLWYP